MVEKESQQNNLTQDMERILEFLEKYKADYVFIALGVLLLSGIFGFSVSPVDPLDDTETISLLVIDFFLMLFGAWIAQLKINQQTILAQIHSKERIRLDKLKSEERVSEKKDVPSR